MGIYPVSEWEFAVIKEICKRSGVKTSNGFQS
jgi:hypothetical protein